MFNTQFPVKLKGVSLFLRSILFKLLNHFYRLTSSEPWEGVSSVYVDWRSVRRTVDRGHRLGGKVQFVLNRFRWDLIVIDLDETELFSIRMK